MQELKYCPVRELSCPHSAWRPRKHTAQRSRARGIRRPLVFFTLLWIGFLLLCKAQDLPLRRRTEAENRLLREADATLFGLLCGTVREAVPNAGGSWSITLTQSAFRPEEEETAYPAGTVLVYFPLRADIQVGWQLSFRGPLSFFPEADNPGSFDARAYYLSLDMA